MILLKKKTYSALNSLFQNKDSKSCWNFEKKAHEIQFSQNLNFKAE